MKTKIITKHVWGDITKKEDYFKNIKRPYKIQSTNYTSIIENDKEKYIIAREFTGFGFLKLLQKFRADVNKNIEGMELKIKDVKYFEFNEMFFHEKDGSIEGIEIDISKAYIYAAYYCKFISDELLKILLSLKKSTRLKILGSLATKKRIFNYNENGELINKEIKKNDLHLICWNNICSQVDDYMNHLINLNNPNLFVFYWFDNLFFYIKNENNFNSIDKKYILKIQKKDLSYEWLRMNLLSLNIEGRIFNFTRRY